MIRPESNLRSERTKRFALIGLAIGLSIVASLLDVATERAAGRNYLIVFVAWLAAIPAFVSAFLIGQPRTWRSWLHTHRGELITIGLITLAAAALRFYQLGLIPKVINGDEGLIGQFALTAYRGSLANPFALFENFGSLYLHAIDLALTIFGRTPFALRLMPAIGGTLAIPALYLLAHYLFGRRVAIFAAIMLAVTHAHLHFSRTAAVAYIQGTWLIPLELYFFVSGLEKRSRLRLAIGGVLLGLHFCVYFSAQIIIGMLIIYLVIVALLERSIVRRAGRAILIFWLGFAIVALPQMVYNTRHPDEFMARLNADGTFESGWLANEVARTGQSAAAILGDRVVHVFLSYIYYPSEEFYGTNEPVLDIVTAVLFLLGLLYALRRTRQPHYLILNGYFWSFTLSIGLFTIPPGSDSYRVLGALPVAILFAAIGLNLILIALTKIKSLQRLPQRSVAVLIVGAVIVLNLKTYFVDFAQNCRYEAEGTRFASYLGSYLSTLDRHTTVYLLSDDNYRYGTHMSVDFLSSELPVKNFPDPASEIQPDPPFVVVAPPTRTGDLRAWSRDHPGGQLTSDYDCGQLILLAYQLP
jgi:4-amino-4-deoxy-L-arabinose transferase-like glycosyltransferase